MKACRLLESEREVNMRPGQVPGGPAAGATCHLPSLPSPQFLVSGRFVSASSSPRPCVLHSTISTRTANFPRRLPVFAYNSVTADSQDSTDSTHPPAMKSDIPEGCWSSSGSLERQTVGIAVVTVAQYISRRSPGHKYGRQHDICSAGAASFHISSPSPG